MDFPATNDDGGKEEKGLDNKGWGLILKEVLYLLEAPIGYCRDQSVKICSLVGVSMCVQYYLLPFQIKRRSALPSSPCRVFIKRKS